MTLPALQAILDVDAATRAGWDPLDLATAFLDGGATFVQIRAKHLPSGPFLDLCDRVVALARPGGVRVIVNDRADLARLSGASGVHVGQDDLPPRAVRELLGRDAIVGFSTHTVGQIDAAVSEPITYVAVGPVFGTATKDTGYAAVGLSLVGEAVRRAKGLPVVAIGGITPARALEVAGTRAAGVAVVGAVMKASDPTAAVAALLV